MQNLPNFTLVEGVVVGSAMLVLWIAPALLGWSDARRRRKVLAQAAAHEAALHAAAAREAALHEAALHEAAMREAALLVPPVEAGAAPSLMDLQQLWDEPTVTVDLDALEAPAATAPPATVSEGVELPAPTPIETAPLVAAAAATPWSAAPTAPPPVPEAVEPPTLPEVAAPLPVSAAAEPSAAPEAVEPPHPEPLSAPQTPAEVPSFKFCLEELRRVRLPDWPPAEVQADPLRNEMWRDAERLAAERQREIGATPLAAAHPVQSSCLGAAEADPATVRLHFLLFPVLWPSTEEQATAEAVFEIDRASGAMRSQVNSLRRSS